MSILAWIAVGFLAGWLAGVVRKGTGYGVAGDIIIGIVGALLAGSLTSMLLGNNFVSGLDLVSTIAAFVGAVILIAILRVFSFPERV